MLLKLESPASRDRSLRPRPLRNLVTLSPLQGLLGERAAGSGSPGGKSVISFGTGGQRTYFPWLRRSLGMKEVKSERERGSRRRHRDGDMVAIAPAVVVKQERLSPESAPPVHRRPDSSGGSPSPPAGESGRPSHRGNRARGGSR